MVGTDHPFLIDFYEISNVVALDNEVSATVNITNTHPVFDAHFEGNPLVPGFLQIDLAMAILKGIGNHLVLREIRKAKFKQPVYPGDQVEYRIELDQNQEKLTISVMKDDVEIMMFSGFYKEVQ